MFQLYYDHAAKAKDDILSGLTVALALVPEAVAFAFVAGVHPLVGLYAAFMVGLITSLIGGRPGMISGATGALAVVMVALVAQHGVEYLFATVVLMGVIQIGAGLLKLGKFIRMVPYPVLLGFVNGLAIVIFLAQLKQFQTPEGEWMSGSPLYIMAGLILLTMLIMHFLPKLTRAVPSGLAAIVVISVIVIFGGLDTKSVGDIASIGGGFPPFHIPEIPLNFETLQIIFPYAVILAAIGLIESLLTMSVIDEMTGTRGHGNRVCIGQGASNLVSGFFGTMGGCAMIGQSMINISSGGLRNLSGIAAALFLLSFILFASPLIEMIPVAALVGIMFMVVIGTFEWGSFNLLNKIPREDSFVGILVAVVTVFTDLAIAVVVGVIATALIFAWKQARHIYADTHINEAGSKIYVVHGPLFFASVHRFNELFDIKNDPEDVIIDFAYSRVADHSAIETIDSLADKYTQEGKTLHLRHLSIECKELLERAGDLVEVNIKEDPHYHVADDKLA
ncbi:sulfate permease, SulP family [Mariprofundus ferrinatatus]|uniref:Sulfate permease, SulP family n=1 Tax=Mariprofundus ferrinatatus TaxID=1921087 RepID=A0A2K8L523_9PROT|nr:SulP family inorganic anion transporter [Mariprofundus ferrinatatus]ATX81339.1 sulfate permease, SulP family [Mariprofundus ferrinatatus]